jgi:hypothetical protein
METSALSLGDIKSGDKGAGPKAMETSATSDGDASATASAGGDSKQRPPQTNSSSAAVTPVAEQKSPVEAPKKADEPVIEQPKGAAAPKPEGQQQQQLHPAVQWKKRSAKSGFSFIEKPDNPVEAQLKAKQCAFVLGLQRSNNNPITLFAGRSQVKLRGELTEQFSPVLLLALAGTNKSPKHFLWIVELGPESAILYRQVLEDVEAVQECKPLMLNAKQKPALDKAVIDCMSDPAAYARANPRKSASKPKKERDLHIDSSEDEEDGQGEDEEDDDGNYSDSGDEPPAKRPRTRQPSPRPAPRTPRPKKELLFRHKGAGRSGTPKSKARGKRSSETCSPALDSGLGFEASVPVLPPRLAFGAVSASDANVRPGSAMTALPQTQVRNLHRVLLMCEGPFAAE